MINKGPKKLQCRPNLKLDYKQIMIYSIKSFTKIIILYKKTMFIILWHIIKNIFLPTYTYIYIFYNWRRDICLYIYCIEFYIGADVTLVLV
ncbi:hypothetical protein QTP88_011134 [Uroleucon formosanum]